MLTARIFVREGMVLGLVALLLLAYYLGKSMNERRAKSWQVATVLKIRMSMCV